MIADQITSITDDIPERWARMLWHATTLDELQAALPRWRTLADDAIEDVAGWGAKEFNAWRVGLRKEHRRQFAGEEWALRFGAVLLPERMLEASMVAERARVPWGLAWRRLVEARGW